MAAALFLLPALALASPSLVIRQSLPDQSALIQGNITQTVTDVNALNSTLNTFGYNETNIGLTALTVYNEANAIQTDLNNTINAAQGSSVLTNSESQSVYLQLAGLLGPTFDVLNNLVAHCNTFSNIGVKSIVLQSLQTQRSLTQGEGAALQAKLSGTYPQSVGFGTGLILSRFDSAINIYQQSTCPPPGSTAFADSGCSGGSTQTVTSVSTATVSGAAVTVTSTKTATVQGSAVTVTATASAAPAATVTKTATVTAAAGASTVTSVQTSTITVTPSAPKASTVTVTQAAGAPGTTTVTLPPNTVTVTQAAGAPGTVTVTKAGSASTLTVTQAAGTVTVTQAGASAQCPASGSAPAAVPTTGRANPTTVVQTVTLPGSTVTVPGAAPPAQTVTKVVTSAGSVQTVTVPGAGASCPASASAAPPAYSTGRANPTTVVVTQVGGTVTKTATITAPPSTVTVPGSCSTSSAKCAFPQPCFFSSILNPGHY